MNERPITQAEDPDLRFSLAAMQRAARRAREIARATNTRLVVVDETGTLQSLSAEEFDRLEQTVVSASGVTSLGRD